MRQAPIDKVKLAKAEADVAKFEEQLQKLSKIQMIRPNNSMCARMIARCEVDLERARERARFHSLPAWTS